MPSQQFTSVVPIGGAVVNLLAGSQFEFVGVATRVQVFAVHDPIDAGIATAEVFFGQELELATSPLGDSAGNSIGPKVPDDQLIDDIAAPGDRIIVRLAETGAVAPATVRALVTFTPLG